MKQHTPTRAEKEALTDKFLKGVTREKLPESYRAWPESIVNECFSRAESRKRVEAQTRAQRYAKPAEVRTTFETVSSAVDSEDE